MSQNFLRALRRELQAKTPSPATKTSCLPQTELLVSATALERAVTSLGRVKKGGGGPSRRGSSHTAGNIKCDQAYIYKHIWKLDRVGGNYYLDFGTLVHTGLAYHYASKMTEPPLWYQEQPDVEVAMVADAKGKPKWLRDAKDLLSAYKRFYASDTWAPLHVEEEFEATVGSIDPDGEDEPPFSVVVRDYYGNEVTVEQPSLNNEVVTCRPDVIFREHDLLKVGDHKTGGGGRGNNSPDMLPPINGIWYDYLWQQMYNLTIVRQTYPDTAEFVFNRVKRDVPYDFQRMVGQFPSSRYERVPKMIRASIRAEREKLRRVGSGASAPLWHQWECGRCDFRELCDAETPKAFDNEIRLGFHEPISLLPQTAQLEGVVVVEAQPKITFDFFVEDV